jgi:hypothetical protein
VKKLGVLLGFATKKLRHVVISQQQLFPAICHVPPINFAC